MRAVPNRLFLFVFYDKKFPAHGGENIII